MAGAPGSVSPVGGVCVTERQAGGRVRGRQDGGCSGGGGGKGRIRREEGKAPSQREGCRTSVGVKGDVWR